ncbi:CGNR zinc finger domain-containing protein [Georgenia alba]|uniref:CGNR zinc finger domain-containing protein n=1 Tax=Georgenia alba TaxID=2233858 RepID=A0ABW2Q984_9MICO
MRHPLPDLPASLVTDLVNEWGTVPARVSSRPWTGFPEPTAPWRRALEAAWPDAAPGDAEIARASDAVHPVFAAGVEERRNLLNGLVERVDLQPLLLPSARGWSTGRRTEMLVGAMVATLVRAVDAGHRLGVCAAADCADVYLDGSPAQNRRFCSVRCQGRERVRAHRAHRADRRRG